VKRHNAQGEVTLARCHARLKESQSQRLADDNATLTFCFQLIHERDDSGLILLVRKQACKRLISVWTLLYLQRGCRLKQISTNSCAVTPTLRGKQLIQLARLEPSTHADQFLHGGRDALFPDREHQNFRHGIGPQYLRRRRWQLAKVAEGFVQPSAMGRGGREHRSHLWRNGLAIREAPCGCVGDANVIPATELRGHETCVDCRLDNVPALLKQCQSTVGKLHSIVTEEARWEQGDF
jgi:hypothetical protein